MVLLSYQATAEGNRANSAPATCGRAANRKRGGKGKVSPLTDGLFREDVIDQMRGALDHPSGATRGADAASLAGKRHQVLVTAGIALSAQKPVLEQAAPQIVVKLLFDELR